MPLYRSVTPDRRGVRFERMLIPRYDPPRYSEGFYSQQEIALIRWELHQQNNPIHRLVPALASLVS